MKDTLSHRGPDDSGIYINDCFGFAHARLSIIDLTTGHQPMVKKCMVKNMPLYTMVKFTIQKKSKRI